MLANVAMCLIIASISYIIGESVLEILVKRWKDISRKWFLSIIIGIVCLSVYAQWFSLFHAVDQRAFCGIILICFICIAFFHQHLKKRLFEGYQFMRFTVENIGKKPFANGLTIAALLLILLYVVVMASQEIVEYDTLLYHAQAVRWIEDYGYVKGAANLCSRVGFNSSIFSLYALFSMKWLCGFPLLSVNSFFCTVFATEAVIGLRNFKTCPSYGAAAVRIVELMYIFLKRSAINSWGADFPNMLITAGVLILWIEFAAEKEEYYANQMILVLLIGFSITIKLSSICLFFLAIVPLIKMIRKRDYSSIVIFSLLGLFIALPFFIRNYFISGWLLYPFATLDIFQVPWKLPVEVVQKEADWVYSWGRIPGAGFDETLHVPFMSWIGTWWKSQVIQVKIVVLLNVAVTVMFLAGCCKCVLKKDVMVENLSNLVLLGTLILTFAYWMLTAPDIRFLWITIMVLPCIGILNMLNYSLAWKTTGRILVGCYLVVFLFNMTFYSGDRDPYNWRKELVHIKNNPKLILVQADFPRLDLLEGTIGHVKIYYPQGESDQLGYYGFPGVNYSSNLEKINLLGKEIEDGFSYQK